MVVSYVRGDARRAPRSHALMHCVGADLLQRKGFASTLSSGERGRVELRDQHLRVGDVGVLARRPPLRDRTVLALVTKLLSPEKAKPADFRAALSQVPAICKHLGIHHIACPSIGTGRDGLRKEFVREQLQAVFSGTGISVTVFLLPQVVASDSRFRGSTLAGDSNLLRVLGPNRRCQQGHVLSGGNIKSVRLCLARSPPRGRVVVLVGTNDLLDAGRQRTALARDVKKRIRGELLALRKVAAALEGPVTFLTIPPCRVLPATAPMPVDVFNAHLRSVVGGYFNVVDLNAALKNSRVPAMSRDGVHINGHGVAVLKSLLP